MGNFSSKTILDGVGELLPAADRERSKATLLDEVVTNLKLLHENMDAYIV
jgi:hypothetical protein